mgnify:CR=1 FL=1
MRIVTDSAADFEPEELVRLGVESVSLGVSFGETFYRENETLTKAQFYTLLQERREFPRTSQPSPREFRQVFRKAQEAGEETLGLFLSSGLSGTYQGAELARRDLEYRGCCLVDSRTASAGQRILVEHAAALREQGKGAGEIAAVLEELKGRVVLYACLDTLKYLQKGGRISAAAAAVGAVAGIKPILTVTEEGRPEIVSRALGMRRAVAYLQKQLREKKPDRSFPVYLMYTQVRENALLLQRVLGEDGIPVADSALFDVGAVIGSHIGPNACGLVYVREGSAVPG